ncbi:MAG: caspase family protein [Candidatus Eisenbacteria bacterium]|nr:caspase family protein [Candidatus Eisenbacteria bacterium]
MAEPFSRLDLAQFTLLLYSAGLSRRIDAVHVHHTWRPRRADFRGRSTIEAMHRYHTETLGWSDIAQHITIDPMGGIWTGRNWNRAPASQRGHNGTSAQGPFMIEMVGDFDRDRDPFDGEQRDAALLVVAHLLRRWNLKTEAIRFHRDLNSPKSCPGTGIDLGAFVAAVGQRLADLNGFGEEALRSTATRSPFPSEFLVGYEAIRPVPQGEEEADATITEDEGAGDAIEGNARNLVEGRQREYGRGSAFGHGETPRLSRARDVDPEWRELMPHVVNLSRGELSERGEFATSPGDLMRMLERLIDWADGQSEPRLLLYAHGGLVKERDALRYARDTRAWWLRHGVYPIFFVWESGLWETIVSRIAGPRGGIQDAAVELLFKIPGSMAWGAMKESARRSSAPDVGDGAPGGAFTFIRTLAPFLRSAAGRKVQVHAAGHSAGSIFHAHLLPRLIAEGVGISSVSFLAPAVTSKLFKENLLPHFERGDLARLSIFTMEEKAERLDPSVPLYGKSLLYLVSRGFEGFGSERILGLHESLREDKRLSSLFALDKQGRSATTQSDRAELQLSIAPGGTPNPLARALQHGDFDGDRAAMAAVLRRVLKVADETRLGEADFPLAQRDRAFEWRDAAAHVSSEPQVSAGPAGPAGPRPPEIDPFSSPVPSSQEVRPPRRTALCIGIDRYRDQPLQGCVADARSWGAVLEQLDFRVSYLTDGGATREAMLTALRRQVREALPGDVLVFQYAGHGTQMPDLDSDESDGHDEALVPFDYASGALLLDDDLRLELDRLPSGVAMTLFMDCCHAGTNSRFAPPIRARLRADERVRWLRPTEELFRAHRDFRDRVPARSLRDSFGERTHPGVIHFAACTDSEYAHETNGHGDFTSAATPLLAGAFERRESNEGLLAQIRAALAVKNRQSPQLMQPAVGMEQRPLLSPLISPPPASTPPSTPVEALPEDVRDLDRALLRHVEAMAELLRARIEHG